MVKVITYGTYDLLHYGHIRLLERAKALGDYLIVGITTDSYDMTRGKINVQQSLEERIAAVQQTGIADKIIIEEYEGQKIEDIKKYGVDIFTVGSDWVGFFDYLNEYCKVVYLDRTQGVSSSELRSRENNISLGIVGYDKFLNKVFRESSFVNGISINALCSDESEHLRQIIDKLELVTNDYHALLEKSDAVYIHSHPGRHYDEVKVALLSGRHVLCESPIALSREDCAELQTLAEQRHLVLMEAVRTAYSTAYYRMLLLIKGGIIGRITAVDATCTSLTTNSAAATPEQMWSSMSAWGPTGLLPVFQILGTEYSEKRIVSRCTEDKAFDLFSKIDFVYPDAVASVKVGVGVKSEGELVISGTRGYVYVPAPWWKTEYFELRYEDPAENKRYFYQLDGEGIRYELVSFVKAINMKEGRLAGSGVEPEVTRAICGIMEDFAAGRDVSYIG